MKILVDENVPGITVEHLRELGHDVRDIRGTAGQGLADADLWGWLSMKGAFRSQLTRVSPGIEPLLTMAFSLCGCASPTV